MVKLRDLNSKVVGLVTSNVWGSQKGHGWNHLVEVFFFQKKRMTNKKQLKVWVFPKKAHQKEYPVSMKDIRTHFASSLGCIEPNQD